MSTNAAAKTSICGSDVDITETSKSDQTLIIAEAGVNHNGSLETAIKLVDEAALAGADVVKFQTFLSSELVTRRAKQARYQKTNMGRSISQFEMIRELELKKADWSNIANRCASKGIEFLSTAFDRQSLDLLLDLGIRRVKIPSGELTNGPLLLAYAKSGKPLILSTGMAKLQEVEDALGVLAYGLLKWERDPGIEVFRTAMRSEEGRAALKEHVTVLQCTTEYPTPDDEIHLRVMTTFRESFDVSVGLSDHSTGIWAPIAATAMGASVVEKHFTLSRDMPGPDHAASLEPEELQAMVRGIQKVNVALGDGKKTPSPSEAGNISVARRYLVAVTKISKGEAFTEQNISAKRSGSGISPMSYWQVLGHRAKREFAADEPIEL